LPTFICIFFFYFGEGFFILYKQRENKKSTFDRYYRRLQHPLNFDHKFKLVMSVGFGNIG